tara:strand:+ start:96 stop:443 length:348 start_codon:yes stop_codon:yes gene_type:complete
MEYFKIESGVIVNHVVASYEFINSQEGIYIQAQEGYGINDTYDGTSFHKYVPEITDEDIATQRASAIRWRNKELKATDYIVPIVDHSSHEAILAYRVLLRDWTLTEDFPATKPTI